MGSVATAVVKGTLPVPEREEADEVPLPYGPAVEDEDEEPPVPVGGVHPSWTETVTVAVSVTVNVGNAYCLFSRF